jgi:acetyl esterase/lipase
VFFLSYTLVPHATYPTQLQQAVEALRYILTETGRSPADVLVAGDSAGGNLALALLGHLSHWHPDINPLDIVEPLAGIAVTAPWVGLDSGLPPATEQSRFNDSIDIKTIKRAGSMYLNGKEGDNWSRLLLTTPDWWKGARVKDALILAGSDEILLPSIGQFEKIFRVSCHHVFLITFRFRHTIFADFGLQYYLQAAVPNTTFVVGHGECHGAPISNLLLGITAETEQGKAMKTWLASHL